MADYDPQDMIKFLNDKWKGKPCLMCGEGSWAIQNKTFQLMEFNKGSLVVGGPIIPVIPVICNNCGNTVLVSAITAGVVEKKGGEDG